MDDDEVRGEVEDLRRKLAYHRARGRELRARVGDLQERLALARADPSATGAGSPPPVYGVTRYSVFAPGDAAWRLSWGPDADAYKATLWAAERMTPREQVFLRWAVPIYQRFHDEHGYRHLVLHSPDLPARWLDALRDAAATYPVLQLVAGDGWASRIGTIIRDLRRRDVVGGPIAWLRVDDDDLLATDFVDRLLPLVTAAHDGWCVSFAKGLTAEHVGGRLQRFGVSVRPMSSMGQAFVGHVDAHGKPVFPPTTAHGRVHRRMPTLLDSREPAYLRLLHDQQDRAVGREVANPTDSYKVPDLEGTVRRLFPTVVESSDLAPSPAG